MRDREIIINPSQQMEAVLLAKIQKFAQDAALTVEWGDEYDDLTTMQVQRRREEAKKERNKGKKNETESEDQEGQEWQE